jgi:LAO/AO transport system kinase
VPDSVTLLLERYRRDGHVFALSRALSIIESAPARSPEPGPPPGDRLVHRIGVTGPGGAGKSTLVGRLIGAYRRTGRRVAVLAIDPSSPVSGGSVLGDRLRMDWALDDGAFVRSLATRRAPGAVAAAAASMLRALESTGRFDVIVVETAGAGQADVAIAGLVDTVVVVTVPGLGDAVQAIKAGILEIADLAVVNMADRPGADESARHLRTMLDGRIPVLPTVATDGRGVDELLDGLDAAWTSLQASGELARRRGEQARRQVLVAATGWLGECMADIEVERPLSAAVGALLEEAGRRWRT